MRFEDVAIPAGFVWSSPFVRWQGALADASSLDVAVWVTARALRERGFAAGELDGLVLGWTVPQVDTFYGVTTVAARLGAPGITGPMLSQACATSVACLQAAASSLDGGDAVHLALASDRTSNGPLLTFPAPSAPGGAPRTQLWVVDSFARDPWATTSMLQAGDTVAAEIGVGRAETDAVAVLRYQQYQRALADDRAFQRRYLVPVEIPSRKGPVLIDADEGVRAVDAPTIARLPPVDPAGVHTFATQTHPADGCAGALVTSVARARELAGGQGVVRLLGTGFARVARTHMPQAPVPAARAALAAAGLTVDQVDAVTTHNPFAVNDLYFAREMGYPLERMNAYGCSLIWGHPQAPTGLRSIAELVEELRLRGGGVGLFTGCAAGDTGAAVVLRVED